MKASDIGFAFDERTEAPKEKSGRFGTGFFSDCYAQRKHTCYRIDVTLDKRARSKARAIDTSHLLPYAKRHATFLRKNSGRSGKEVVTAANLAGGDGVAAATLFPEQDADGKFKSGYALTMISKQRPHSAWLSLILMVEGSGHVLQGIMMVDVPIREECRVH
jgi:hypothetical protein